MRSTLLASTAALVTLLVACGGSESPQPSQEGAQPAHAPAAGVAAAEKPMAAAKAPMDAPGAKAPAGSVPTAKPKLVSTGPGGPAMLDTGIDLSHLKDAAQPSAFPEAPQQVGPPAAAPAPSAPPGAVELVAGEEITDFGEMLEGEKKSVTFRMKSTGENPLFVERVKPSCGCTAAALELVAEDGTKSVYELGAPIPPGSELEIGATVNTTNRRGPFSSNIAIYSNDPASPMRLQLKADVKAVLEVNPQNLDLGMMTSGDTKESIATITTPVLDPFHLELDTTIPTDHMTAELTPIDPDAEGRAKTWELKVVLGPDMPEGMRRYQVRMKTDVPMGDDGHDHGAEVVEEDDGHGHAASDAPEATRELVCNVMANVTALVVATPNFISLGVVRPGEPVERTVRIESLDPDFQLPASPEYRFQSLTGGEFTGAEHFSLSVAPTPDAAGKSLDVTLRLEGLPDDYQGSFGGMVTLAVGHPTKPEVNVRFSGVARPGIPATSEDN
jgi:hypothetical protein